MASPGGLEPPACGLAKLMVLPDLIMLIGGVDAR
jgi:hypothetical protein